MAILSGCDIAVSGESCIEGFRVKHNAELRPYTCSGLSKGTGRLRGPVDWTGRYWGYGHTPAVFPGDEFTPTMSIDESLGATGLAICTQTIVRGSIENGGPVEFVVEFGGNGALTLGSAAATDNGPVMAYDATDMKIAWDGVDLTDIRDQVMVIRRRVKKYSTSAEPRVVKRTVCNVDVQVMWRFYEDAPASMKAVNTTDGILRFYVTSSTYWQITNMRIETLDDFGGEKNKDENVGATMIASFNAATNGTATGTIINPAGAQKWPAVA